MHLPPAAWKVNDCDAANLTEKIKKQIFKKYEGRAMN